MKLRISNVIKRQCPICQSADIHVKHNSHSIWACRKCKVWFRNPMPNASELETYYHDFYSDKLRMHAVGTTEVLAGRLISKLQETLSIPFENMSVLDLGAGSGGVALYLAKRGARVTAVEPEADARATLKEQGIVAFSDLESVPKSHRFHLVVSLEVLEHIRDPLVTLREVGERMERHGHIFISTPNRMSLNALIHGKRWKEFRNPSHLFFHSSVSVGNLFALAGFGRIERTKWLLSFNTVDNALRGRILLQYLLQLVGLDGGLRFTAAKAHAEDETSTGAQIRV